MSDIVSHLKRSQIMATIKGQGNRTTEIAMVKLFKQQKISGWRRHSINLPGRPDFSFPTKRTAIFVDGCFWHGCRRCRRNLQPSTNERFWRDKFIANKLRDRRADLALKRLGWRVVRVWEHEIKKSPETVISQIVRILKGPSV